MKNVPSLKSVIVKYFVTGHSYNAGDRDFGLIKKKLAKVETVFTVKHYAKLIESARKKPSPFKVMRMSRSMFHDYSQCEISPGVNFVPLNRIVGKAPGDETTEKIKWFHIRSIEATYDLVGYKVRYRFKAEDIEKVVSLARNVFTRRQNDQQDSCTAPFLPKPMYPTGNTISIPFSAPNSFRLLLVGKFYILFGSSNNLK